MKSGLKKSVYLMVLMLFAVTFGYSQSKKPIRVSPVAISWNAESKAFNAEYTIFNDSKQDRELSAIITFQSTKVRWWRGAVLPEIKAGASERFSISFPAYILLKNDYREISVKLYGGKNYKPFLDKSSNYQSLSSKVQTDENLKVVFASSVKDTSAGPARQPETLVLGKKSVLRSLLISSLGEGAKLKRITGSGTARQEEVVAEFAVKKTETADLLAEIDAMEDEPLAELEEDPESLDDSDFAELESGGLKELESDTDADSLFALEASEKKASAEPLAGKAGLMENFLKAKMKVNASDISSRSKLVRLYVTENQPDRAIALLKTTLQARPDDLDASLTLSKVYKNAGKVIKAVKLLAFTLGRVAVSARNAISQEIRQALKQGKSSMTTLSDAAYLAIEYEKWGQGFLKHKLYDKALLTFQKIQGIIPDYPMIDYHIGLALKGQEKHDEAVASFWTQEPAIEVPDNRLKNLFALAETLPQAEDTSSAGKAVEQLESLRGVEQDADRDEQIETHIALLQELLKPKIVVTDVVVIDSNNNKTWQKGETDKLTWDDAIAYCRDLSLSGFSDWRLPEKNELKTAYVISSNFPDLNPVDYWSSTQLEEDQYLAWTENFSDGEDQYNLKSDRFQVRCVRNGSAEGSGQVSSVDDRMVVRFATFPMWAYHIRPDKKLTWFRGRQDQHVKDEISWRSNNEYRYYFALSYTSRDLPDFQFNDTVASETWQSKGFFGGYAPNLDYLVETGLDLGLDAIYLLEDNWPDSYYHAYILDVRNRRLYEKKVSHNGKPGNRRAWRKAVNGVLQAFFDNE
jgi:tetratricopeptide (TPR) repeat protein